MELQSFLNNISSYAILSHCWEEEEIVFADIARLSDPRKESCENVCTGSRGWDMLLLDR
jgi:hypothetical protein